ncbi:MAG: UbiD family decarboxylase [Planctomycetaceae bacterium]|jgi:4-hydroxy-3-polyprenylbenzoate decarboxylase|nr:UbiD family decarboxylase [Planctomycetaceae bacterium]
MGYRTLKSCIDDLRRTGQLIEFSEPVHPSLEIAAVQRRLYQAKAPAVLFTQPVGTTFPMLANLFGTQSRIEFIFRDGIEPLRKAIELGIDPVAIISDQLRFKTVFSLGRTAFASLLYSRPKRVSFRNAPVFACRTTLDQLPQLISWQQDGGPYLTLPQVYTEHPDKPGFAASNLGMYRVQLAGNNYAQNFEAGLHYQIHRGIAAHHAAAIRSGQPLRVNVFVGGAPAMTLAAVMPLPEGVSELLFAGILGQHRIPMAIPPRENNSLHYPYSVHNTYSVPNLLPLSCYAEADFCITGILHTETKTEGPFGDHLGYYSLAHEFPVMKVESVWHRRNAILPFTVVGRPPQEDTQFGRFIHQIIGDVVPKKIPGVYAVHAVDAAGVHPLLLALGREHYCPLDPQHRAAELHTLAHAILGCEQLSLAKFLFLAAREDDPKLDVDDVPRFLKHVLLRVDWRYDAHFVTQTTADTLDYSDAQLNRGSKLFVAVSGQPIRDLSDSLGVAIPAKNPRVVFPGVLCVEEIDLNGLFPVGFPLIVRVDDSAEVASDVQRFLWTTFTKSDPAHDIYGVGEFVRDKHWGCVGPLVIDARRKPHHAPELVERPDIAERAERIVQKILAVSTK